MIVYILYVSSGADTTRRTNVGVVFSKTPMKKITFVNKKSRYYNKRIYQKYDDVVPTTGISWKKTIVFNIARKNIPIIYMLLQVNFEEKGNNLHKYKMNVTDEFE